MILLDGCIALQGTLVQLFITVLQGLFASKQDDVATTQNMDRPVL